jgi:type 1 fimbriae regulatory protein FimB/type 1 fimbriae regulatory protein FimE
LRPLTRSPWRNAPRRFAIASDDLLSRNPITGIAGCCARAASGHAAAAPPRSVMNSRRFLIAYRHGLRASELCDLQWSQVELNTGRLHVRRAKSGSPSVHPLRGEEIRALRRLQREQGPSSHVFMTERDGPMTPKAFHALFGRIGARARMPFPVHPHMLRHGCGYALANAGHDTRSLQAYLGHKNIQHTVRYTELAPDRFKDFWR